MANRPIPWGTVTGGLLPPRANFCNRDLQRAWVDHGGLPLGSELRIRLAAIKEHVGIFDEALQYANECLKVGGAMKAAVPTIPVPDIGKTDRLRSG